LWGAREVNCVIEAVELKDKKIKHIKWSANFIKSEWITKDRCSEEKMWDISSPRWNKEIKNEGEYCCQGSGRLQQTQRYNIEIEQNASFWDNLPER
jgi:hypothetical protein